MEHVNFDGRARRNDDPPQDVSSSPASANSSSSDLSRASSAYLFDVSYKPEDGSTADSFSAPPGVVDLTLSPMLRRYPSFVPLRRRATSIAEVAFLVPSADCSTRRATALAATFNMTATIIGGGVLSIPLSCARAGVVPFTVLMVASAMATDLSLYLLVSCSRRCGSTSFGGVAKSAFGTGLELCTTLVITLVVLFTTVGLMKLNQGIWSPIVMAGIASFRGSGDGGDEEDAGEAETTKFQDAVVLMALLVSMTPFLLKKDLTSLSNLCYVGFFSIAILCVAMAYRAAQLNLGMPDHGASQVKWMATSGLDILNALPIILCAFLCSFNMISVSCSLIDPTRERVKSVIHRAVFLSFLVMYVFGLAGYLFAYEDTQGNILLNFGADDPVILLGRVGCGITTLFALPMNTLPCREAMLSVIAQVGEFRARRGASREEKRQLLARRRDAEEGGGENGHGGGANATVPKKSYPAVWPKYGTELGAGKGAKVGFAMREDATSRKEEVIHLAATFGILVACYVAAILANGVEIVWDISGSSMVFLIQFILPAACYVKLKLRSTRRKSGKHLVLAWALLILGIVMAILCTTQVALRLSGKIA